MIRINLLGVERVRAKKAFAFDIGQQVTVIAGLILVVTVLGIGWWFWSLRQQSQQLDRDIASAQQESTRLRVLLAQVEQFEAQRQELQQRVALIRQLRSGQGMPVQLLDQVSSSVPDMLWLTTLTEDGQSVTIEGRSTTLIALSDFVGNLGDSDVLVKPIEIVNSQVQPASGAGAAATPEVIAFTVKAQIKQTEPPAPPPTAAPAGRGAVAGRGAARGGAARGAAPARGRQGAGR
jgi:type IV pilus assembly protein PilN